MNLRHLLSAAVTLLSLCSIAVAAEPTPPKKSNEHTVTYCLRNFAAADAVHAVKVFAAQQKWTVSMTAEPVSNTVLVAGDANHVEKVTALLTALDKAPPRFMAQMLIVQVPVGFAEDVGLGTKDESKWELTAREAKMLSAAIRLGKETGKVDILSRPQLMLTENQTGLFQVGSEKSELTVKATPRLSADGASVYMRLHISLANPYLKPSKEIDLNIETRGSVPAKGGTIVVKRLWCPIEAGQSMEVLVITTVAPVDPS